MEKAAALKRIRDCGVIAIIRATSSEELVEAADAIVAGGIIAVEFTLTTPDALQLIDKSKERLGERVLIGAGTVLNEQDAKAVLEAGAQFIVMPVLNRRAIDAAQRAGVPIMPGAFTPTEIVTAWEWGADLIKLFPASLGGPEYLKAIHAPLPHVGLVPTGGVNAANASDYIRAGAVAVAVGGNLVDPAAIATQEFWRLTETAQQLIAAIRKGREDKSQ